MQFFTVIRYAGPRLVALVLFILTRPASAFDAGTLAWQIDDATYYVPVPDDNHDASLPASWRGWWYVRLDVPTDRPVQVEIDRIAWVHPYLPVFSYDQTVWQHVAEQEVFRHDTQGMTVTRQFISSPVYLAQRQPYTTSDLETLLEALAGAPAAASVQVETLGSTPQGRPLVLVTIGNAATARGQVWVHARVHPGEPQSSWVADGMLRFLASDNPTAQAARAALVFHVVPILNMDGVALGHYRTNALGENMESLWDIDAPPHEVEVLRAAIATLSQAGPPWVAALNLHSSHASHDQSPFFFPHFGPETMGYTPEEARLWKAQTALVDATRAAYTLPLAHSEGDAAPLPAPAGRQFLQVGMPERWWWRTHGPTVNAVTVEAVDGQVGDGGRWYTAADAQALGSALARGILATSPPMRSQQDVDVNEIENHHF